MMVKRRLQRQGEVAVATEMDEAAGAGVDCDAVVVAQVALMVAHLIATLSYAEGREVPH